MEGHINEEDVGKNEDITEGADDAEPEPEPEPDNTMTFAEYMASKGDKEENTGRTVESEFKGVSAAVKKEEEDFMMMGGGKQKKSKKKNDAKKQTIDVGFRPVSAMFSSFSMMGCQHPVAHSLSLSYNFWTGKPQ